MCEWLLSKAVPKEEATAATFTPEQQFTVPGKKLSLDRQRPI